MDQQTEQPHQHQTLTPEQVSGLYKQVDTLKEQLMQKAHVQRASDLNKAYLPADTYPYHNYRHVDDVLTESLFFALADRKLQIPDALSDHELELLATAAVYHEIEYFDGPKGHEQRGADTLEQDLPNVYSVPDRMLMADAIRDTQYGIVDGHLSQKDHAKNTLGRYLMDADMSNFGRDDFFDKMSRVYEEQKKLTATDMIREDFERNTLQFITHHQWKSEAANMLREPKRLENVQQLTQQLSTYS